MRILSVTTYNFRNLESAHVSTDDRYVTLVGNNGQGKTNFLEAIYAACYGTSFRKATLSQLCTFDTEEAAVHIEAVLDDGDKVRITYQIKDRKRSMFFQNKEIRDRKDLIYILPCIVFTHEDIDFVDGSPEAKRKFYNQTMTLHDPLFLDDLRRYSGLLKQRNALLKEQRYNLLYLYDEQLAETGAAALIQSVEDEPKIKVYTSAFCMRNLSVSSTDHHGKAAHRVRMRKYDWIKPGSRISGTRQRQLDPIVTLFSL